MPEIPPARRDLIASRLVAGQPVSSGALAVEFNISEDAIRRDLRALAAAGICRRVYGGALPLHPASTPLTDRMTQGLLGKRAVAEAAVSLIDRGTFLFLDSGSTNAMAAQALPHDGDWPVATNSVEIAAALAKREDVQLMMIGGVVDALIGGCVDSTAIEAVSRLNIDLCILGACSLSPAGGVSAFETADAHFKRVLIARSQRVIVLATNEKLSALARHQVAPLDAIDRIVVEHDAPSDIVEDLEAAGATVLRARPAA